jgi:dihydrofolate synthase/folylpolyglutamate synthase
MQRFTFQQENIATAIQTCRVLEELDWAITEEDYARGISCVSENTNFIGRWQKVSDSPLTILDSAHNVDGIIAVVETLDKYSYDKVRVVLGMVDDKDINGVLSTLPKDAVYYFCKAKIPRAKNEKALKELALEYDLKGSAYNSVSDAYNFAIQDSSEKDMVLVLGSIFVVGDVLENSSS